MENSQSTPPSLQAMKLLATPEGMDNLRRKIEPVKLAQGIAPFKDESRSTDPIEQRPVEDRVTVAVGEQATVALSKRDFSLFTLGPVYWALKIPFDLVEEFAKSSYGVGAVVQRLGLPTPFLPDVPGWDSTVEAVSREHWDKLVLFLSECMFTRSANYWTICGDACDLHISPGYKVQLAVFTPRCLATRIRPWNDEAGYVRLSSESVPISIVPDNYARKISLAR